MFELLDSGRRGLELQAGSVGLRSCLFQLFSLDLSSELKPAQFVEQGAFLCGQPLGLTLKSLQSLRGVTRLGFGSGAIGLLGVRLGLAVQ